MKVTIDIEALTMRDLRDMERLGINTDDLISKAGTGSKALTMTELTALVWVMGRKEDPALTYDDVLDAKLLDMEYGRPPEVASGATRNSNGSRPSRSTTATRRKNSGN